MTAMTISRLPVRELPLPGESLTSYVRRSAMAMGYDRLRPLLNLLEVVDLPPHLDHLRDETVLCALARLLGQDVKVLTSLTVHRFAGELMLRAPAAPIPAHCDSKTILRFFNHAHSRVCPQCLRDTPAYERLSCSFRPLINCPQHGILWLDRCPGCQHRLSSQRLDIARCSCGFHFADTTTAPVISVILDMSQRLVSGFMDSQVWANGFSIPAGFWWLERLAAAMRKTSSWLSMTRTKFQLSQELSDEAVAWVGSLELLLAWPEGMADFLDAYQVVDKHRSTSTGVSRSFGLLLREADYLEHLGYPAPANMLRDYLLERYTRGHLTRKVSLFRPQRFQQSLTKRPWLTQTEAAQLLNVSQGNINSLLRQQLLVGQVRPAGNKGRTVGLIARESVQKLRTRLAAGLSVREVAMQLGIDRHRVAEMIRAHLFASAMRIGHHWLVAPENVAEWLSWLQALPPLPQEHQGGSDPAALSGCASCNGFVEDNSPHAARAKNQRCVIYTSHSKNYGIAV
jgi:plasmid maintenance system antidote protein VapI